MRSSETSDLFVALTVRRLKKNGRAIVVVPDGFLFGNDNAKTEIKKYLMKECNLHTIIRLPQSCFAPYTSIATNLLFFDKTGPTKETWFYRLDMPKGYKHFSKTKPMVREHFAPVDEWWDNRVEILDEKTHEDISDTWKSKKYTIADIEANGYNIDFCGYPVEEKVILSPEDTIKAFIEKRETLEAELKTATDNMYAFLSGDTSVELKNVRSLTDKLSELNSSFPKNMKDAILQAAMQGKLTKQLEDDGNVYDYLNNVVSLKASLIKEKKLKKDKTTDMVEDEYPFDIPENWAWTKLGIIANLRPGKTPPRAEPTWWGKENDVPWVSIADMVADGHVSKTKEFISQAGFKEKFKENISPAGTMIMSFKLTVGRVSYLDIDALHNEAIISIFPFEDDDRTLQKYLFKVLPYLTQYGNSKNAIKGETLNADSLCNLYVPLPPFEEQHRIVDKLEQLLPLCESLEAMI